MKKKETTSAFSLVEVVVALAITVFAGFALIGLLAVGLQSSQDSKQRLQAATIAESLCSTRRAAPTNDFTTLSTSDPRYYFPLPILATNITTPPAPVTLSWDGATTNAANARFGLIYTINTNNSPGAAAVHFSLYWPAQADPTKPTTGFYEVSTTIALP